VEHFSTRCRDCLRRTTSLVSRLCPLISFECTANSYRVDDKRAEDYRVFALQRGYAICDLFGNDITATETWHAVVDRLIVSDFYHVPADKLEWFNHPCPTGH
jgi:hypothetical protein